MTELKISVVTPVYNGERFLAEALESVLAQTWQNWELVLLDNNSSDNTASIAADFAKRDSRVRLFRNEETVDVITNHNIVVRYMSPDASYCKVLHADDTLEPTCLERMAEIAMAHPGAGIIGAWTQWGDRVMSRIEPHSQTLFSGAEIGKQALMGECYPFLSPSCLMIRNDLLLARPAFYEPGHLHADVDAAYALLKHCDFGIAQELLVTIRRHDDSVTSASAKPMNTLLASNIELLALHGPHYLTPGQLERRFRERLDRYYLVLARAFVEGQSEAFWRLHADAMAAAGRPLSRGRLYRRVLRDTLVQPRGTLHRLRKRWRPGTGQPIHPNAHAHANGSSRPASGPASTKTSLPPSGTTMETAKTVDSKLVMRWRRNWMKFAHHPRLGRLASSMAALGMPPHYGRLPLARLHPRGFVSPRARIAHSQFSAGKRCFIGDGALIYEDSGGGSVHLEDGVHLHENNTIQTGDGGTVTIGAGTHVQPRCQFSAYKGNIVIGKEVEIAPGVGFYPYNHSMDPSLPIQAQPIFSKKGIRVDDEAWLG